MVEPQPSKLVVRVRFPSPALSIEFVRKNERFSGLQARAGLAGREIAAAVAQLVERVLGKDEVTGPSPVSSSWVEN